MGQNQNQFSAAVDNDRRLRQQHHPIGFDSEAEYRMAAAVAALGIYQHGLAQASPDRARRNPQNRSSRTATASAATP